MGFVDLFRPKWKHSNVAVRAAAVRQLGAEDDEILASIARSDGDPNVRRIAIKKLSDLDLLLQLGESDDDEGLRQLARSRAHGLLVSDAVSPHEGAAMEAVERITEQKTLAMVTAAMRTIPSERIHSSTT